MKDYLMKLKVNTTMYYDYEKCYWEYDKPDYGKLRKDYSMIKKGTNLYVKVYDNKIDNFNQDGYKYIAETKSKKNNILYKDIEDIKSDGLIDVLEDINIK